MRSAVLLSQTMESGGSAVVTPSFASPPMNTLSQAGMSMEDSFLSTRKLGLLQSRFKIPRHLTFRERKVLKQRAEQRKAQLDADEKKETELEDAFQDFENRLKKVKKKATSITLKDVIAAKKPCDETLTLNL